MTPPAYDITPWARVVQIPDGVRGTVATLDLAAPLIRGALLDPLFALWVRDKITAGRIALDRDPLEDLRRIYDYVQTNIRFQRDPAVVRDPADPTTWSMSDYVQSPHWTLFVAGEGDCLAHAAAVSAMALALCDGAALRVLRADLSDPDRFSHVYAVVGYNDATGAHWIPADTTMENQPLGYELPNVGRYSPADYDVAPAP